MSRTTRHRDGDDRVHRSYTSEFHEQDSLFQTYEHLHKQPRSDSALLLLRKIASLVKPIMRKRSWHVGVLAEFLPSQQNLLGLNVNHGEKICLRLRYHRNADLFLPLEEIVDTMLHELSHIIFGPHDSKFHKLWDGLRDEYEVLARKGYTGEGFLSEGRRLGGSSGSSSWTNTRMSQQEMRRLARAGAEKRKTQSTLHAGSGRKLGGSAPNPRQPHTDIREVIVDSIMRRNNHTGLINDGCASGTRDADRISDQASQHAFKTRAEEDDANDRAIAQALYELMEQEEMDKLMPNKEATFSGPSRPSAGAEGVAWDARRGLYDVRDDANQSSNSNAGPSMDNHSSGHDAPSEEEQLRWAMQQSLSTATSSPESANLNDRVSIPRIPPPIPLSSKPPPAPPSSSSTATKRKHPPSPPSHPASLSAVVDLTAEEEEKADPSTNPPASGINKNINNNNPHRREDHWSCLLCTCINPQQYLACDACGSERPLTNSASQGPTTTTTTTTRGSNINLNNNNNTSGRTPLKPPHNNSNSHQRSSQLLGASTAVASRSTKAPETLGWVCARCGAFMEHMWWTCSACGRMKDHS